MFGNVLQWPLYNTSGVKVLHLANHYHYLYVANGALSGRLFMLRSRLYIQRPWLLYKGMYVYVQRLQGPEENLYIYTAKEVHVYVCAVSVHTYRDTQTV